ncbi:bifunctional AP-4-A phosphorylase/ADP sulfurylase [Fusarium piperis]|uniref:Bifunctional AP-4-A phosphorylase/ADP sulfurylase n=1 Tax=Fusarium piperis TaxID=1435070 RepID=A0A9W9BV23_9HYPO|nr:bifunctional AP-4-A phosphorylase/ADP sulfurylase [Fusarium piperis]
MPGILPINDLPRLVSTAFSRALGQKELTFYSTEVAVLTLGGVPFQLRFAPGLSRKPEPGAATTAPQPTQPEPDSHQVLKANEEETKLPSRLEARKARMLANDVFKNPPVALRITDLGPSHYLVLNKFAIAAEHFILATNEFKDQDDLLERDDFAAIRACIDAYDKPEGGEGLFTFFNSGEFSGASQAHRHVQMIPISRMKDGLEPDSPWSVVADKLTVKDTDLGGIVAKLPFTVIARNISGMDANALHSLYLEMYQEGCIAEALNARHPKHDSEHHSDGTPRISYNLAMTKDTMVLLPRLSDKIHLQDDEGKPLDIKLSVNGTILAGTVLVKEEHDYKTVQTLPGALKRGLQQIGVATHLYPGPLSL